MVETIVKKLAKKVADINEDSGKYLTWRDYVLRGTTYTAKWRTKGDHGKMEMVERKKTYTAQQVLDVYNYYERELKNGNDFNLRECLDEEKEEGHKREWLDNVVDAIIDENMGKNNQLVKDIMRTFHDRLRMDPSNI